jgi:hypothetical protein
MSGGYVQIESLPEWQGQSGIVGRAGLRCRATCVTQPCEALEEQRKRQPNDRMLREPRVQCSPGVFLLSKSGLPERLQEGFRDLYSR